MGRYAKNGEVRTEISIASYCRSALEVPVYVCGWNDSNLLASFSPCKQGEISVASYCRSALEVPVYVCGWNDSNLLASFSPCKQEEISVASFSPWTVI